MSFGLGLLGPTLGPAIDPPFQPGRQIGAGPIGAVGGAIAPPGADWNRPITQAPLPQPLQQFQPKAVGCAPLDAFQPELVQEPELPAAPIREAPAFREVKEDPPPEPRKTEKYVPPVKRMQEKDKERAEKGEKRFEATAMERRRQSPDLRLTP